MLSIHWLKVKNWKQKQWNWNRSTGRSSNKSYKTATGKINITMQWQLAETKSLMKSRDRWRGQAKGSLWNKGQTLQNKENASYSWRPAIWLYTSAKTSLWMFLAQVSKMEFKVPCHVWYRGLENTTIVKRNHTQTGKQLVLCTLYSNNKSKLYSLKSGVLIILLRVQNIP
jgi:hypothetical protein